MYLLILLSLLKGAASATLASDTTSNAHNQLFGYDCNSTGVMAEVISLDHVKECMPRDTNDTIFTKELTIYQIISTDMARVLTCRVSRTYSVIRCGMYNHQMILYGPIIDETIDIGRDACEKMVAMEAWKTPGDNYITGIRINSTTSAYEVIAGTLQPDGTCSGSDVTLNSVTYPQSFISISYKVTIQEEWSIIHLEDDKISIQKELMCSYRKGSCFDSILGMSYWDVIVPDCDKGNIITLFSGESQVKYEGNDPSFVKINVGQFLFATLIKGTITVCNKQLYTTDYKHMYVSLKNSISHKIHRRNQHLPNIDFSLYVNAKLTYMHYQTLSDFNDLYKDVIFQLCEVSRQTLENKINIIRMSSQGMIHIIGVGERGSFLKKSGEVVYLTKCPVKRVFLRAVGKCYNGIPIEVDGENKFLLPISRAIVPEVETITCSEVTPFVFKYTTGWLKMTPQYHHISDPSEFHPYVDFKFKPTQIQGFAEGGIYTAAQIETFYRSLTFPTSREAIINELSLSFSSHTPMGRDITSTFNDISWKNIAKHNLNNMWGWFVDVGEIISGCVGVYFTLLCFKFVLSLIIRAFSLYQIFGLSWKLGGAIMSSITTLLLSFKSESWINSDSKEDTRKVSASTPEVVINPTAPPQIKSNKLPDIEPLYPLILKPKI